MDVRAHLPITPFVGRDAEIDQISALLHDPTCRLLTLVGPGGVGKTRLALEAACRLTFADGVGFAPLQPLNTAEMIVPSIADALDFQFSSGLEPKRQLLNYLDDKTLLLILDNIEHLIDEAVPLLMEMLARAQNVKILTTSREILNIQGEWVFEVEGLPFPPADFVGDVTSFSAVQLFTQNARRVRRDFSPDDEGAGIVRVCSLVRGMPLALELASAWVRTLTCDEIADEIAHGLDILETAARDVPSRHRSMRATLEHSWDRLTPIEQAVFSQLSIFRGGFTREAAQTVAGAALRTLSALVDKSWLRWTISSGRYEVHELLRQFGEEKLAADDALKTCERHACYYAALMGREWARLTGPDMKASLETIESDLDNVRSAWHWAVEHQRGDLLVLAMDSLWLFYDLRSLYHENERAFGSAAAALRDKDEQVYAQILARHGHTYFALDDSAKGRDAVQTSLDILEHYPTEKRGQIFALMVMGQMAINTDDSRLAISYFEKSLAICNDINDLLKKLHCLEWLGYLYIHIERAEKSWEVLQEGLALSQEIGNPYAVANMYKALICTALALSRIDDAIQYGVEALALYQDLGILWGIANTYNYISDVFVKSHQYQEGLMFLLRAFETALKLYLPQHISMALLNLTQLWLELGRIEQSCMALALYVEWNTAYVPRAKIAQQRIDEHIPPLSQDRIDAAIARVRTGGFHVEVKKALEDLRQYVESHAPTEAQNSAAKRAPDALTGREREILRLVAQGHSNREIATKLVYSPGTVKWYLNQIYGKLHVGSRTQAVARAHELKLFV